MQIYLARNNQQAGPYTVEQVNQMLTSQQVLLTDLIWHTGMSEWKTLGEVTQGQLFYYPEIETKSNTSTPVINNAPLSSSDITEQKILKKETHLAPISKRAFAKILDILLWIPAGLCLTAFMSPEQHAAIAKIQAQGIVPSPEAQTEMFNLIPQIGWYAMAGYLLIMFIIQAFLLHKTGQSIGKKVLAIQIVDAESKQQVSVNRSFVLRSLLFIIMNLFIVPFVFLIDWAFAAGKKRQTLHDRLAKTIVIDKK